MEAMTVGRQDDIDIALRREGETIDDILGRRLRILQKERGYRFSIDSLLLAHFVQVKKGDSVADLGTGGGIILLLLSHRSICERMAGVEIQEELADMARRSIKINGLEKGIEVLSGDIRQIKTFLEPQAFDVVIFNPPYRKLNSGRINPDQEKAVARHEIKGTLGDFLLAAKHIVKESGCVYIIYPATRMAELFFRMRDCDIEPRRLRMVHSGRSSRAEFVLMEGKRGGGEELKVSEPLFIYEENGRYTGETENIFRELSTPPSFFS